MATAVEIRRENVRLKQQLAQRDQQLAAKNEQVAAREQELREQFLERIEEVNRLHQEEIEQLKLEQKLLIERVFAHRSERYIDDPLQLKLDLRSDDEEFNLQVEDAVEGLLIAADEVKQCEQEEKSSKRGKKNGKRGDGKFPEQLVKKVVDVDFSDEEKQRLTHIGYDPVQKLHMKRPEFWVVETRYHKYVDPSKQRGGVMSPPRQEKEGLVRGDHYDSSVAAEIVSNRFGYHQPFYRLQDFFAASGWTPSRSTLANLQSSTAQLIMPFYL